MSFPDVPQDFADGFQLLAADPETLPLHTTGRPVDQKDLLWLERQSA